MQKEELLRILGKKPQKNISILGFLDSNPVEEAFQMGDTVFILGRSDHRWAYISSDNADELRAGMRLFGDKADYFSSLEPWMVPIVARDKKVEWELRACRYVCSNPAEIATGTEMISDLDVSHAAFIHQHLNYREFISIEYVTKRIEKDAAVGVFENDCLAAWGLTHDDGALGFLHVLPEFRRRGYGEGVIRALVDQKKRTCENLFVNIEKGNLKSKNLFIKLGFLPDREIRWVKLT